SIERILQSDSINWIMVNDGSTTAIDQDDISRIYNEVENFTYFNLPKNLGKGFATRYGVSQSKSKYVIYTDIDFPYLDENVATVAESLRNGSDLVIATRDQNYYHQISGKRAWISKNFRSLVKFLFRIPTT